MNEAIVVGILGLLIGLIVCLRGYATLRVVISLLGAWVGFFVGAGIVAGITSQGFLSSAFAWAGGIVGAIVLALLAYALYQVAVLLGMGALGFSIATGAMAALGVSSPVLVWVIGGAAAVLMVVLAMLTDLPAGILVILTALAGANITLTGLLLLLGHLDIDDLEAVHTPDGVPLWASGLGLVLAVVGMIVQTRGISRDKDMRAAWAG